MRNIRFDTISELGDKGRVYNYLLMVHGYNNGFGGILTMFGNITKLIKLNSVLDCGLHIAEEVVSDEES